MMLVARWPCVASRIPPKSDKSHSIRQRDTHNIHTYRRQRCGVSRSADGLSAESRGHPTEREHSRMFNWFFVSLRGFQRRSNVYIFFIDFQPGWMEDWRNLNLLCLVWGNWDVRLRQRRIINWSILKISDSFVDRWYEAFKCGNWKPCGLLVSAGARLMVTQVRWHLVGSNIVWLITEGCFVHTNWYIAAYLIATYHSTIYETS